MKAGQICWLAVALLALALVLSSSSRRTTVVLVPAGETQVGAQTSDARVMVDVNGVHGPSVLPGKYLVAPVFAGLEVHLPLRVRNENPYPVSLVVGLREPDFVETGYSPLDRSRYGWFSFGEEQTSSTTLRLAAEKEGCVTLNISVPEGDNPLPVREEVWVSCVIAEDPGLTLEACCRVFVSEALPAT